MADEALSSAERKILNELERQTGEIAASLLGQDGPADPFDPIGSAAEPTGVEADGPVPVEFADATPDSSFFETSSEGGGSQQAGVAEHLQLIASMLDTLPERIAAALQEF